MAGRRGSTLVAVLALGTLAAASGMVLMDRSMRSLGNAAGSRQHLVLRSLAEAALEELDVRVQQQANTDGSPIAVALRTRTTGPLPAVAMDALPALAADVERELGGHLDVTTRAVLEAVRDSGNGERTGAITLEARIALRGGHGPAACERVRELRTFKVSRIAPPASLSRMALLVAHTSTTDLSRLGGRPAIAGNDGSAHSLRELLTGGFRAAAAGGPAEQALAQLSVSAMERRAQIVVGSPAELAQLFQSRLANGGSLSGVIRVVSPQPVRFACTAFRGRCLVSCAGPVVVGDVRVEDATRDRLTIASDAQVLVTGHDVQADVIALEDLVMGTVATVHGSVVSGRFPHASGLTGRDLGRCRFGASRPASGGADDVTMLSVGPLRIEHARGEGEWPAW